MFKIESYVTPILLSYVDKYVKDFRPADAQLSLWGGGVVLHNLVIKTDVLQQEVALPFTLVSGRIHELFIQVPWTKIMSEPIVVNIDTIECILSIRPPSTDETPAAEPPSRNTQVVEAPPGYMQALVRRIVSNIAVRIHHLIIKYVQDDIILSLNVKHLSVDSAAPNWQPAFADIDQHKPAIRRLVVLDDLTLCLDSSDSDGKIRFYQDPLLYRCRLEFRVLIKLVSANTRRASNVSIQLRSSKLAWGVTSEQMVLVLRLLKERIPDSENAPAQTKLAKAPLSTASIHNISSNQAEPARPESWSEWAWSWMPSMAGRDHGIEEAPPPAQPLPISAAAYLDDVSLSIKLMELEGGLRRRARSILEFHAKYAAFKSKMCLPTSLRFKMGIRTLHIKSFGKCTCGHMDYYASYDEATMYLSNRTQSTEDFKWPEDNLEEKEKKIIVKDKPEETTERILNSVLSSPDPEAGPAAQRRISVSKDKRVSQFKSLLDFEVLPIPDGAKSDANDLWTKLEPLIFMEYSHERTPPNMYTNPYENPPSDFEYSDWEEQCNLNIQIKPIEIRLCMGLIHRLKAIQNFFGSNSEPESDIYLRVLTVEECDALLENLPQQRVNLDIKDFRIRVHPWDHSPSARPRKPQVVLDVSVPKGNIIVTLPLYPNRVCSAASQMPDDTGPLGRGSRVHVTAALNSIQASICSLKEEQPKPCVRADLRFVVHVLLHPEYFNKKKSVLYSYALKIREANVSGSSARLHAASQVLLSVINQTMSLPLYYTTLAKDALNDEELVALDITLEELSVRGYITKKVTTHILQLQAIRATVIQSPGNSDVKQAWLFSGPDVPTNTAYIRIAAQWCSEPFTGSMDFLGIWSEPGALAIDPLFVSWLSYKPLLKSAADASPPVSRTISATMYLNRRRNTPPPSRAKSASSQAEQVHQKARSADSSSEFSELKDKKPLSQPVASTESWWKGEKLLQLHERLKKVFITMELGLLVVYITTKTASAVDCATVRLAMENHATNNQGVLVFSAGRWSMCTSTMTINLWHFIDHEGPTYIDAKEDQEEMEKQESFPWKMMLADMSCYALESKQRGKLGQLKMSKAVYPRTVLELISTSIILSVAKKTIQSKLVMKKSEQPSHHHEEISKDEKKMKYFTAGVDFKPANLKDFCRGPEGRFRDTLTQNVSAKPEVTENKPALKTVAGPTVSLGFNLHADTPPIIVKIEHDQVYLVFSTLHCLSHVLSLLGQDPMAVPKQQTIPVEVPSPPKHVTRSSLSEMDEISLTESSRSETRSDLMTIFEAQPTTAQRDGHDHHMRTFLWFQWVVSTATLVISTDQVKLAFDIDDMITTIDLQEHYNQLKIKIASASIKQYERSENGQWTAGVLGGRVLEALEPPNPNEASHFLTVTVTQARISNLPGSWREELHPKCLEQKNGSDSMWEVFATLAPLEIVILPAIMDNVMSVINAMAPRSYCQPLIDNSPRSAVDLPFVYINGGGIRFLLNCDIRKKEADDTFLLTIGKIAMNPHPDNPICRRPIAGGESAWNTLAGNLEGRQYEIFIKGVSLRTARLAQLVSEEESVAESQKSLSSENPAVKWGSSVTPPVLTPVLHPLDINFVLAPSLIVGGVLTCGPAYEFNLTSDCAIEINIDQLNLAFCMQKSLQRSFKKRIVVETDEINTEVCPYADILVSRAPLAQDSPPIGSTLYSDEVTTKSEPDTNIAATLDSGVETATSRSTLKSGPNVDAPLKKTLSVTFVEQRFDAADHIEVFVTMGVIELSLYTIDDGSSAMVALKPPHTEARRRSTAAEEQLRKANRSSRSLTEVTRTADVGVTQMDLSDTKMVRKNVGNIPLCHITLHQPNLYYWKRRSQTSLQVSLFNIWVGFGLGLLESYWHCPLISTTKGVPDPVTEIPPALATMKYTSSSVGNAMSAATSSKVNLQLDIERPILIELSEDSLRRLVGIYHLLKMRVSQGKKSKEAEGSPLPLLFRIRNFMAQYVIDAATMNISQLGITGFDISAGWDSVSMQVSWNARRERLIVRGLINSLLISSGSYLHAREPVLQPLQIGIQMEAIWEAWRRAEGGYTAKEPTVRFNIDADRVTFDIRPENLAGIIAILNTLNTVVAIPEDQESVSSSSSESISEVVNEEQLSSTADGSHMTCTAGNFEMGHHYYKDDLRSGAFKIVSGGQLPMAYQVTLHRNIVSWKYPHPRSITRIIAFPLPNQNQEIDCVLEFYDKTLLEWLPHTFIKLPVNEPKEHILHAIPPESVFSTTWRFRTILNEEEKSPFIFNMTKFQPKADPSVEDCEPVIEPEEDEDIAITAEQLSGVLRVDSYFAPHLTPRNAICLRFRNIQLNVHNSLPSIDSGVASLEGYYVSKQLMRAHRVLTITAEESTVHTALNSSAGILLLLETLISSDILDCTTGIMERMIKNFRVQAGLSIPGSPLDMEASRVRCCTTNIHVALHVPRLRTLLSLADDWTKALGESQQDDMHSEKSKKDLAEEAVTMLEGRVSLWIHNSCASTLRIGQENTEEVILLGPGVRLAYRWNSPTEIRRIRFASGNQTADWHWSNSIPFVPGDYRVRLEHEDPSLIPTPNCGEFVSVVVKQIGAHREMRLSGRLLLANMLRLNLLYKVREHTKEDNQWHTASTGELSSETINRTIICHSNSDLVLKIRFLNHETGWSGDIPLKECPKENVPWLVKVPSNGDVPYISVWCRVVRARSDGRIFATIWPLYVLRSDLTLDTDVLLSTDMGTVSMESSSEVAQPAPIIQSAPGRGSSTHLLAPGTTSARHSLSFQYRNIECPVTRDAVPLHYGVTDTSVFDKRAPVNKVDEILKDITAWLERSGQNAVSSWPYSIVSKHWVGEWKPALLQPRCEVTVQYQAVRAGGGCSLEIKLSPLVIICNASPITLTLRAHDAAPMCKLEPGSVISPPPTVLKKPFFMSIEIGRETFVSNQLQVCCKEPGRYESPPTGQVAIDYPITFAIQCNQKVTLLNLYYEVKEEINVLGITSAYIFFNKLDTDLMVSAIVVPNEISHEIVLNPKTFKSIPPAKPGSVHGKPLCRFWLRDRWRGGDVSELQMFLCIALPHEDAIDISAVPIRLGLNTERKAISLMSSTGKSMPIVVTQHKHEGRWIVTVDKDPCPQFVVHNQTGATIAIAQPKTEQQEENFIETVPDCVGTQWWLTVAPDAVTHYSTPGYCIRHPVPPEVPVLVPFLTFAKVHNEEAPVWCPPVAVADGEQLVQLTFNVTVKLHVRTYPHSTLIELKDVDQHDISASEIRRRLIDQDLYNEAIPHTVLKHETSQKEIDRVGAHERLISTHTFSVRDTKEEQEITRQEFLKEIDEAVIEVKSSHHHLVEPESAPKLADITPSAHRELKVSESFDMKYERAQAIMKQKMRRNLANTDLEPKPSIHIILKYPSSAMTVGKNSITALEKFIGVSSGSDNNPQPIAGSSSKPEATTNAVFIGSAGSEVSTLLPAQDQQSDWEECSRAEPERLHCVIAGIVVEMAAAADTRPLVALHIDRAALQLFTFYKKTKTTISIADVQIDNLQYDNGQFDFAVIATTRAEPLAPDHWTTLWSMFTDNAVFATKHENARILLKTCHDSWTSASYSYNELTEVDVHAGPLALYVEDAYVTALAELFRLAAPAGKAGDDAAILAEFYSMRAPLRLRLLYIRPLDITLTLHTAVRMYIALDQSPLHLGAFRLQYMFTSTERLAHALTVHYLSAAILGAGWVVGGLELLGAPGALAARVGGATGGVRGIASAAAAALLRSLSAWAGSLARNLDLLAGDEEHARRAAAARRRPPDSFVAGLLAGITNFAINILGAVGGLAHHPLVGVAVGETGSSTAALRRGLLGALTKPLSATADLVAYAGHGLLKQTGWDPVPQPRSLIARGEVPPSGWTRECVRWLFRLPELTAIVGHEATLGDTPVMLLFTHKFLVIADPLTESIMESIDFRFCTLGPFDNSVIELSVRQANERRVSRAVELDREENDDLRVSAAAMARVARYTGAGGGAGGAAGERARLVALAPAPGHAPALYALLTAAIHHNSDTHFSLM